MNVIITNIIDSNILNLSEKLNDNFLDYKILVLNNNLNNNTDIIENCYHTLFYNRIYKYNDLLIEKNDLIINYNTDFSDLKNIFTKFKNNINIFIANLLMIFQKSNYILIIFSIYLNFI